MSAPRPSPGNPKQEALRRARRLHDDLRLRGEFNQRDFRAALSALCCDLTDAAYDGFLDNIAETVDRQAASAKADDTPSLFNLGYVLKLGNGRRIDKRLAVLEHFEESLALSDANLVAVQTANLRDREELIRLRPYLMRGLNAEQAVASYLTDHPEEGDDAA
jgi:hypothetical protein